MRNDGRSERSDPAPVGYIGIAPVCREAAYDALCAHLGERMYTMTNDELREAWNERSGGNNEQRKAS